MRGACCPHANGEGLSGCVSSTSAYAEPISTNSRNDNLMTGDEYRSSLRDGRRVIGPDGIEIDDITTHPQFAPAIDTFAEYYDALLDPRTADLLTYIDSETGRRSSVAWSVPRSREDLERKRAVNRYVTHQTMGVFGRPPDYSSGNALGLLSLVPELREMNPAWATNAESYQRWGRDNSSSRRISGWTFSPTAISRSMNAPAGCVLKSVTADSSSTEPSRATQSARRHMWGP